jgi:hypothetical protein
MLNQMALEEKKEGMHVAEKFGSERCGNTRSDHLASLKCRACVIVVCACTSLNDFDVPVLDVGRVII